MEKIVLLITVLGNFTVLAFGVMLYKALRAAQGDCNGEDQEHIKALRIERDTNKELFDKAAAQIEQLRNEKGEIVKSFQEVSKDYNELLKQYEILQNERNKDK